MTAPAATVPREPFFQAGIQQRMTVVPPPVAVGPGGPIMPPPLANMASNSVYAISLCGSLKENLERIMGRYHWRVVWQAPYDFNFDGRVLGSSLPNVIEKLMQPFPLQAVMYMSNRTVKVVPRFRVKV